MSLTELPVIDRPRRQAVDLRALQQALAEAISTHDVRSDRLSRALYATDASVYQIVPLMVAFPGDGGRRRGRRSGSAAGSACRSRRGAAGRRRPASRSGRA